MDNLEPKVAELHAEYELPDQSRARDEIHPASKQDVETIYPHL